MKTTWDDRYQSSTYQYGVKPNDFIAEQIKTVKLGNILIPAAGEGRDLVYAASLGWEAHGFDLSQQGQAKAFRLANEKNTSIHYICNDAFLINYPIASFDVIALSFFHLPPELRATFHQKCISWLKQGGRIIIEGFNKNQLGKSSGGPKDENWLFNSQELSSDFQELTIVHNIEIDRMLDEGPLHQGIASVIQFVAMK